MSKDASMCVCVCMCLAAAAAAELAETGSDALMSVGDRNVQGGVYFKTVLQEDTALIHLALCDGVRVNDAIGPLMATVGVGVDW